MIIDTSALLAILNREPNADRYAAAVVAAAPCRMSVANVLETAIVVESRGGAEAGHGLDAFLGHAGTEPAPGCLLPLPKCPDVSPPHDAIQRPVRSRTISCFNIRSLFWETRQEHDSRTLRRFLMRNCKWFHCWRSSNIGLATPLF